MSVSGKCPTCGRTWGGTAEGAIGFCITECSECSAKKDMFSIKNCPLIPDDKVYIMSSKDANNMCPCEYVAARDLNKDDGPCYYCGEKTNSLAGNPSEWPLLFPHSDDPGKVKPHHVRCVLDRLHIAERYEKGELIEASKMDFTLRDCLDLANFLDKKEEAEKKARNMHIEFKDNTPI